jgi:ATP-binding cassette subfamily B protein
MDARLAGYIASLPPSGAQRQRFPLAGTAAPSGSFWQQVRAAGLVWRSGGLLGVHALETIFLFASWAAVGSGALNGRVDKAWLVAWALCLATLVVLRGAARSSEVALSIGFGGLLKERLFAGAMAFDADLLRRKGIGELLSQVFEAEALEGLATDGGLQIVLATLELLMIPVVLSWGVSASLEIILLLAWLCLTAILVLQNARERFRWTKARLGLTHRLVENMTAHRTKLAQQPPSEWHTTEDGETEEYAQVSERLDRSTASIEAFIPRGYLIAALFAFAPSFLAGAATLSQQAITLGVILFAYTSLQRFTFGASRVSAAYVAWRSIKAVFDAAARPAENSTGETVALKEVRTFQLQNVVFTHAGRRVPSLKNCTLTIHEGDSLLLEGDSGSGKSTLALLLAGMRRPSAGFILAGGLDLQTLGEANWRQRVAAAPQYHENHILSASLSFNLLMGRPYPHSSEDIQEARELCLELGLGSLLERMPSGLDHIVGETGWQLSQGERSRVFLARGLLQDADLVVLDESLAALDPENLRQCLECARRRAKTLMVIAHP